MSLMSKMIKDLESRRKKEAKEQKSTSSLDLKKEPTISLKKKHLYLRYTSVIILLLILSLIIVTCAYSKKQAKITNTKPFSQAKTSQTVQKKPTVETTPEISSHQAIRKQTNNVTAGLIHQAQASINIESLAKKSANISVKKTITRTEKADLAYQNAIHQLNNGSTSEAIKEFQTILTTMPDYKPARVALAATLIKHNQSDQAEQILNAGLKQDPNYPAYAELQAHLLAQNNQVGQALTILNRAQPASISENPDYFAFMAALYLQQGYYAQAAAYYRQLTNYNAQYGNWWAGLSISLRKLGQTLEAQQAYVRAQEAGNLSPELAEYLSE